MARIVIIAGAGQFPKLVAERAKLLGHYVLVCPLLGYATEDFTNVADAIEPLHIGKLNTAIKIFHTYAIEQLCACGAVKKEQAFSALPDFRMAKVLFSTFTKGDDAIFRKIMSEIEKEGIQIIQAAEFLPILHTPAGVLTQYPLPDIITKNIDYALPIVKTIGTLDIGQCIVVHDGMTIAVEGIEGTDATIQRAGTLVKEGCIAVKIAKPMQDMRIDLPSIGKRTVELLIQYKYAALIVEAEKTLFFDMEESIALANKHNVHIVGITLE